MAFRCGAWRGASVRWLGMALRCGVPAGRFGLRLGMAFRWGAWCGASVRGRALVWTFRIVTLGSRSGTDFPARRPCADCPAALAACPQAARKAGKTPKGAAAKHLRQTNHAKNKPQKEAGTAPSEACCLVGFCFLRGRLLKFCFAAIPFSVPGRSAPALFTEYTRSSCARRSDSTRTACHSTGPR